jgi:hypothetical protein
MPVVRPIHHRPSNIGELPGSRAEAKPQRSEAVAERKMRRLRTAVSTRSRDKKNRFKQEQKFKSQA